MKKYIILILSCLMMFSFGIFASCNNENKDSSIDDSTITSEEDGFCKHEYVVTEIVEATCTQPMKKTYTCKLCGKSYTETEGSSLGHTGEWVVTKEPDCINGGIEQRTCTRCHLVEERIIPPVGHNYEEIIEERVEADCTHNGKKVFKCKNSGCDEKYEEIIFAKGHSKSGEGIVHKPTCTEDGYTEYTCSVCGETFKEDIVKASGHKMVFKENVEKTCEHGEGKKYVCEVCGHVEYEYVGEKLPHNFGKDGKCSLCHKHISETEFIKLNESCYVPQKVEGEQSTWIYNYTEGEMNNSPKFNLIIEKEYVDGFIKMGCGSLSVTIDRKTKDHATYISINNISKNDAVTVTVPLVAGEAIEIKDIVVSNLPDWVASGDGWLAADGFKVNITWNYDYNKDFPESFVETESPYKYNEKDNCYERHYPGNYPVGVKFTIRKEYLDDLRAQGLTNLKVVVRGGGTPGIDKDDAAGTVCGTRNPEIAEALFDLTKEDSTLYVDGNLVLRVYSNIEADIRVYLEPSKPKEISVEDTYIEGEREYTYNKEEKCYEVEYKSTYPVNCRLKIKKEYLDMLRKENVTTLNIEVIGEGTPGIDKDDVAETLIGTRAVGKASCSIDLINMDPTIFVNGDIVVRIYSTKDTHLKIYFKV